MNNKDQLQDSRDRMLWELAKKRASFKRHLLTYLVINGFFWTLWLFNGATQHGRYPWPLWASLGWGIGIVFHFADAYVFPRENSVEKEYEKLKNQQNG